MKAYTDLEQSKQLIKILRFETADFRYGYIAPYDYSDRMFDGGYDEVPYPKDFLKKNPNFSENEYDGEFPCWSLDSLLNILPNEISTGEKWENKYQIRIRKYDVGCTTFYQIAYGNDRGLSGSWHDMINTGEKENLVDACVEIIITFHKMNLL